MYQATVDIDADKTLDHFEVEWGQKNPSISPSWQEVILFCLPNSGA
jgi:hypothetical protein